MSSNDDTGRICLHLTRRMRRAYTVQEAAELVANLSDEELEDVDEVQVIELTPQKVDIVSDKEDFDAEELRPHNIFSMPDIVGELEVHLHGREITEPKSNRKRKFQWEDGIQQPACGMDQSNRDNTEDMQNLQNLLGDKSPYEIFQRLSVGLAEKVSKETFLYAKQNTDETFHFDENDILNFFGILYLSGHRQYPRERKIIGQQMRILIVLLFEMLYQKINTNL